MTAAWDWDRTTGVRRLDLGEQGAPGDSGLGVEWPTERDFLLRELPSFRTTALRMSLEMSPSTTPCSSREPTQSNLAQRALGSLGFLSS